MLSAQSLERYARFGELAAGRGGKGRWLVLTHDNPDPDSLAAATTVASLLQRAFHRRATVAYGGIIGRAENVEMVRTLKLRLSQLRHINWKNYRHFALVDTQPETGNNQLPSGVTPDLVIDHHPPRRASAAARFPDIRPDYGATATIAAEYLLASGLEVDRQHATALVYAIRSETQDFSREFAGPDKSVYDELLGQADKRALGRIQAPRLPIDYFRSLHQALEHLETVSTFVVSHLGEVEQPDIVPELADLLVRMEGKTWSLCTGVYDGRVYLSIRTTNPRGDAGRMMRRLLGRIGKGGGHGMTAGGWVPVSKAPRGDARALQRRLAERLARYLKKKPERLRPLDLTVPPDAG